MIRSLIIHDSSSARDWVAGVIASSGDFCVVGESNYEQNVLELTVLKRPDLIILVLAKATRESMAAVKEIMIKRPTPIIITGSFDRGAEILDALKNGALDIVARPADEDEQWRKHFLETLRIASRIKVVRHSEESRPQFGGHAAASSAIRAIAIGASAGGPLAVARILQKLCPVSSALFIVIHFPDNLITHLREWYSSITDIPIVEALDGAQLSELQGKICLAAPGKHLLITNGEVRLTEDAPRNFCRPSIDVLFKSLAESLGSETLGILLTGMGRDGAEGLLHMRAAGGRTIAQDEKSSTVFGMPKAAIDLGAAEYVLPLDDIAGEISRIFSSNGTAL